LLLISLHVIVRAACISGVYAIFYYENDRVLIPLEIVQVIVAAALKSQYTVPPDPVLTIRNMLAPKSHSILATSVNLTEDIDCPGPVGRLVVTVAGLVFAISSPSIQLVAQVLLYHPA
jgi:hypothetical protein